LSFRILLKWNSSGASVAAQFAGGREESGGDADVQEVTALTMLVTGPAPVQRGRRQERWRRSS
jgi:hypothetical protein